MLWRALSIVLFSVSYAASADIRVTFKCDGYQTTSGIVSLRKLLFGVANDKLGEVNGVRFSS
jgi:hypothetical protein